MATIEAIYRCRTLPCHVSSHLHTLPTLKPFSWFLTPPQSLHITFIHVFKPPSTPNCSIWPNQINTSYSNPIYSSLIHQPITSVVIPFINLIFSILSNYPFDQFFPSFFSRLVYVVGQAAVRVPSYLVCIVWWRP